MWHGGPLLYLIYSKKGKKKGEQPLFFIHYLHSSLFLLLNPKTPLYCHSLHPQILNKNLNFSPNSSIPFILNHFLEKFLTNYLISFLYSSIFSLKSWPSLLRLKIVERKSFILTLNSSLQASKRHFLVQGL